MLLGRAADIATRAVDERGGMYAASKVWLGDQAGEQFAKTILPSGVPVAAQIVFEPVTPDVGRLSLLEIWFSDEERQADANFTFRSVPVN